MNMIKKLNKDFDKALEKKNEFQKFIFVLIPFIVFLIAGIYGMEFLMWFDGRFLLN